MASSSCLLMMMLLLMMMMLSVSIAAAAGDSDLTVTTERRVFATPGGRAVLGCSFSCSGWEPGARPLVEWWRLRISTTEKILVVQDNSTMWSLTPRVEWSGDLGGSCNATIAIVDLDRSDVGFYICDVTDVLRYREGRSTVELVLVPAAADTQTGWNKTPPTARPNSYLRVRTSGAVSVQAGIAATLECSYACGATHVQDTVVEWWRIRVPTSEKILVMDGSPHLYHLRAEWIGDTGTCNASIALRDVQENDTGSYLCDVLLLPAYNEGRDLLTLVVAGNSETPSGRDEEDPSRVISITAGAICVGLVVVIAAIIIAAVYFLKKRKSQETQAQSSAGDNQRSEEAMPLQDANTEMATAQPQQDVASAEDEGDDEDDDDDDD